MGHASMWRRWECRAFLCRCCSSSCTRTRRLRSSSMGPYSTNTYLRAAKLGYQFIARTTVLHADLPHPLHSTCILSGITW